MDVNIATGRLPRTWFGAKKVGKVVFFGAVASITSSGNWRSTRQCPSVHNKQCPPTTLALHTCHPHHLPPYHISLRPQRLWVAQAPTETAVGMSDTLTAHSRCRRWQPHCSPRPGYRLMCHCDNKRLHARKRIRAFDLAVVRLLRLHVLVCVTIPIPVCIQ